MITPREFAHRLGRFLPRKLRKALRLVGYKLEHLLRLFPFVPVVRHYGFVEGLKYHTIDEAVGSLPLWCTRCTLICHDYGATAYRDQNIRHVTMSRLPRLRHFKLRYMHGTRNVEDIFE